MCSKPRVVNREKCNCAGLLGFDYKCRILRCWRIVGSAIMRNKKAGIDRSKKISV